MASGIKIIEETEGEGPAAIKGDLVEFDSQCYLSRGDCVQEKFTTSAKIGARQLIAGVEYALVGMKAGGYRKARISPHLAYREFGVPDKIPPNALLVYELRMRSVNGAGRTPDDPRP